jgi:hypothetical protein
VLVLPINLRDNHYPNNRAPQHRASSCLKRPTLPSANRQPSGPSRLVCAGIRRPAACQSRNIDRSSAHETPIAGSGLAHECHQFPARRSATVVMRYDGLLVSEMSPYRQPSLKWPEPRDKLSPRWQLDATMAELPCRSLRAVPVAERVAQRSPWRGQVPSKWCPTNNCHCTLSRHLQDP